MGDFGLGHSGNGQGKAHIFTHGFVRIERIGLKHHRKLALGRWLAGDVIAINQDLAIGCFDKTRNQAQQGRFATAGRADKNHQLTFIDLKVDALDDINPAK